MPTRLTLVIFKPGPANCCVALLYKRLSRRPSSRDGHSSAWCHCPALRRFASLHQESSESLLMTKIPYRPRRSMQTLLLCRLRRLDVPLRAWTSRLPSQGLLQIAPCHLPAPRFLQPHSLLLHPLRWVMLLGSSIGMTYPSFKTCKVCWINASRRIGRAFSSSTRHHRLSWRTRIRRPMLQRPQMRIVTARSHPCRRPGRPRGDPLPRMISKTDGHPELITMTSIDPRYL